MHFQNQQCLKSAFMNSTMSWYILFSDVMQSFTFSCPQLRAHFCCSGRQQSWSFTTAFQNRSKNKQENTTKPNSQKHTKRSTFPVSPWFLYWLQYDPLSDIMVFIFWHYPLALHCFLPSPVPDMQCNARKPLFRQMMLAKNEYISWVNLDWSSFCHGRNTISSLPS